MLEGLEGTVQVSSKLRKCVDGYTYWCQSCQEPHAVKILPGRWTFNGNVDKPTFFPSVSVTGKQTVNKDGEWTGEWVLDENGKAKDLICHTFITDGKVNFLADCTNKNFAGTVQELPDLPSFMQDPDYV